MIPRFQDKRAIVTGAAQGIGQAIALRLAQEGAKVLIADIDQEANLATLDKLHETGADCEAFTLDVADKSRVSALYELCESKWGGLDVQISDAGIMDRQPFVEMSETLWDRIIDVNLKGVFLCGQAAARLMIKQGNGGRIVNMASNSGIFGGRGRAAYGASKAGIINLTQTMAIELAEHNILVNAVAPGATRTRAVSGDIPAPSVYNRAPLPRFAAPEEIASMVCFAASDECSFTTGHVLAADGGFTVAGVMEG